MMKYKVKNKVLFSFNLLFAVAVLWYANFTPNSLYDRMIFSALSGVLFHYAFDEVE